MRVWGNESVARKEFVCYGGIVLGKVMRANDMVNHHWYNMGYLLESSDAVASYPST